jgi:hypothetical protein
MLLNFLAGRTGMVSRVNPGSPFRVGALLVILDNDPEGIETVIDHPRDLFMKLPLPPIPNWAPPLILQEAGELDDAVIEFCRRCTTKGRWVWDHQAFYDLVAFVWRKRLPLTPEEVWTVLEAHGVPKKAKGRCQRLLREGIGLLTRANGRKAINAKRSKPLSY